MLVAVFIELGLVGATETRDYITMQTNLLPLAEKILNSKVQRRQLFKGGIYSKEVPFLLSPLNSYVT